MVFLSIIIPFNKSERYLKDCLDSLAEDKLKDYEIILVINGINDNLDEFLNEYSDLNINAIYVDEEIEVSKARNIGIDESNGKYIYFIDSDDYIHENAISKLISAAEKSDADFINGERINTYFVKDRFCEELEKPHVKPLKGKQNNINYSMKLLVGDKTDRQEILSSLHALIKKEKIGNIRFNENLRYFSDYYFIIELMENLETFSGVENAIYAKRKRDDPVNLTSLNQELEDKFEQYFSKYHEITELISNRSEKFDILKKEIIKTMLKFYYHDFSYNFLYEKDEKWQNVYFDEMSEISKDFTNDMIGWKDKYEIEALKSKNKKRFQRLASFRFDYVTFKSALDEHWRFDAELYRRHYNKNKVKDNQIVFISFNGKYYSDSPKYLYEYLYENYNDEFEFVWVIDDLTTEIPGNPKKVKRFSRQYYKEMSKSKYWVTNGRHAARLRKKPDQVIVSTWHGTPLKRLGLDIGNIYTKNPRIKESYIENGLEWDYLISPNNYTTDILRSSFAYEGKILETGYPRNDILYNAGKQDVERIKNNLNIPEDKKIILYAPTWRDDDYYDSGMIKFKLKLDLDMLQKAIGDEYIILVRTHYFIADKLDLSQYGGFAWDVSGYNDIAELYLISDILITDYSSVFFDFANLKRPILFYTYDLEKYETMLRGFYIDIHSEVPGPLLSTTQEVIDSILNIQSLKAEYGDKYDEFYERFCSIEDGNASKRIVDEVWKR